jgi:hypothetical protein
MQGMHADMSFEKKIFGFKNPFAIRVHPPASVANGAFVFAFGNFWLIGIIHG